MKVSLLSESNLLSNAEASNSKTLRWEDRWHYQGKTFRLECLEQRKVGQGLEQIRV